MGAEAPARWRLGTAEDTRALGAALASTCPAPQTRPRRLYLCGELGAGKTTLAAALLAALGVSEPVRSPSYALLETYGIPHGQAVHLDCYRLGHPEDLEWIGLRDYDVADALWLVEWPERAGAWLPPPDLRLTLGVSEAGRMAECRPESEVGSEWLQRLLRIYPYVTNKA